MNNKAIVIGADHHNTLGVVESLAQKGIRPYVILQTNYSDGYVLHSNNISGGWCCLSENDIIHCLLNNFNDTVNKAIIIATNDIVACALDNHYEELLPYFFLPTVEPKGQLRFWMEKEKMSANARRVGLCVPETWIIKDNVIPDDICYPVITKAISSVAGSKENIKICKNNTELIQFVSGNHCDTIQVQRFIDKEFEFQLLGCSLDGGKKVVIPGRTHIDRPNGIDNTFFLRFSKCEPELNDTIEKAIQFVKLTQYTGPFSIEFLRDKNDKKDYFTEMNFRNDGNAFCVTRAGMNIPYILYQYFSGGEYESEIQNSNINTVFLCPELYYFTRLLAREISFTEWMTNMRKSDCFTTFHKNDIKPFVWFILLAIKKRIKKL